MHFMDDIKHNLSLSSTGMTLFKTSSFVSWLYLRNTHRDSWLIPAMLISIIHDDHYNFVLWFHGGLCDLHFRCNEFCLVIGLPFGSATLVDGNILVCIIHGLMV